MLIQQIWITRISTSVSNIEGTTAIKPVDANTAPMEQSIENALNKPHTITVQANVQYTAGSSTLAGIGLTKANGTPFIKSGHFNDGRLGVFVGLLLKVVRLVNREIL